MQQPVVWVVVEFHYYLQPAGQVSIWMSGRPLDDDKDLEDDVAVKLVGPVTQIEGNRIVRVLQEQLGAAGVTVLRSGASDDRIAAGSSEVPQPVAPANPLSRSRVGLRRAGDPRPILTRAVRTAEFP